MQVFVYNPIRFTVFLPIDIRLDDIDWIETPEYERAARECAKRNVRRKMTLENIRRPSNRRTRRQNWANKQRKLV